MFKKGNKEGGEIIKDEVETIIGPSVKINGDFESNGNIMVAGIVSGKISTSQNIRIEESAKIFADIEANEAVVAGNVEGNINIKGHLEILGTASINGDIKTGSISIEQGAYINGSCTMLNAGGSDKEGGGEKDVYKHLDDNEEDNPQEDEGLNSGGENQDLFQKEEDDV